MNTKLITTVYKELCDKIGAEKVKNDEAILVSYGYNRSMRMFTFQKPSLVILPESREDTLEILKVANREKIPVTVMSAGVNPGDSIPSEGGIVIDFRNMTRILEISTDSNYAVIEPGVSYADFTAALSKKGFRCHIPTAPGGSSALGIALVKPNGSLATRQLDPVINLEVILPDGTIVHTGSEAYPCGEPYSRYVTYPDIAGLFCCACGTLGVITRATLRIYPINESNRVHLTAFDNFESAVKFVQDVTNNNLAEHNIIWNWQFYKTYDISVHTMGKPYLPPELSDDPRQPPADLPYNIVTTLMSGYEEMMVAAESVCAKVAKKYDGKAISMEELEAKAPGPVRTWKQFYLEYHQPKMEHNKKYGLGANPTLVVMDRLEKCIEIEKMAVKEISETGARPVCYYAQPFDFGRAMLFRIFTYVDPDNRELMDESTKTYKRLFDAVMEKYGACPIVPKLPVNQLGGYYSFLTKIKKAVDPNNILNPNMGWFTEENK